MHAVAVAGELLRAPVTLERTIFSWTDHQTHVVRAADDRYIVKLDTDLDRLARELRAHRAAGAAGVPVPEVVASRPGAYVMRFVSGVPVRDHPARDAVVDTGRLLRRLHDLAVQPPAVPWADTVAAWLEPELAYCERAGHISSEQAASVRRELAATRDALDALPVVWCHGDFQTAHVLVDATSNRVRAFLDFADHRAGAAAWDVAVFTIYDESLLDPLLDGYGASAMLRDALRATLPLYRVLRLLGSVRWLEEQHHPAVADHLARVEAWFAGG